MKLINLTPHPQELVGSNLVLPASGLVAKAGKPRIIQSLWVEDEPIQVLGLGEDRPVYVYDKHNHSTGPLPDPAPDTYLIVSLQVRLARPNRRDLLNPSGYIRDDHGGIVGFSHFEAS